MSAAKQIEWLSLVEVTGPFLAVEVLDKAMPTGLDSLSSFNRKRIRSAYEEWNDAVDQDDPRVAEFHREWIRLVLEELLEYDSSVLKSGEDRPESVSYQHPQTSDSISPDFAVLEDGKPKLLITTYSPGTDLESPLDGEPWAASPLERMTLMCRSQDVLIGLVTNGERWTLVGALPDGTASYGSWYARIWLQEPITLQAFQTLLGVRRCFGAADETLGALLTESIGYQEGVTDTLGEQVRRAIEVLIQALDRADLDRDRQLLQDVSPKDLYDAGLTIMMRLVFLLCAEERKLLLLGEPAYDQNYAISTLRSQLKEEAERHGVEVLERRHDAWTRLLATFRGVYGGIEHPDLRLPALGGSLFDPDRYPFLEGRVPGTNWTDELAVPLPIDNRTVLMLLSALQVLEQSSGALHLSYEALDVEQIGHVYEGLLERTAHRVPAVTLGLIGTAKHVNPNVALQELEEASGKGEDDLYALIQEESGRSLSAVRNAHSKEVSQDLQGRILSACGGDNELIERILPFANHLRTDNWDDPLVYRENAFIVTMGGGREETGTHYTPKSLTEPIVQHTLEPLVYIGPAEGKPEAEWKLKSPGEILELKVCDMAMGSGAFLVQACRYLGERLVESWELREKQDEMTSVLESTGSDLSGIEELPKENADRILLARRLIANRCLYGVDANPMAVELAKLSLWLVTLMKNRPFSYLDHAFKTGDSLLGITSLDQILHFSLRNPGTEDALLASATISHLVNEAIEKRRELEELQTPSIAMITEKERLHRAAEDAMRRLKIAAHLLLDAELSASSAQERRSKRLAAAALFQSIDEESEDDIDQRAGRRLNGRSPFHWPLEFPEVFERVDDRSGFDAFLGNPPFAKGGSISQRFGDSYRRYLSECIHGGSAGLADLCAFFFARFLCLLKPHGFFGAIGTNSITESDSFLVGLNKVSETNGAVIYALPDLPWPGKASVTISPVVISRSPWKGRCLLAGKQVEAINVKLSDGEKKEAKKLPENKSVAFVGSYLLGDGFVLSSDEAKRFIGSTQRSGKVVFPYINGVEFNASPDLIPKRYAICFWDWPEGEAREFGATFDRIKQLVKPERVSAGRGRNRTRWWIHAENRPGLYHAVGAGGLFEKHPKGWNPDGPFPTQVIAKAKTSNTWAFGFLEARMIFDQALTVLPFDDYATFASVQSSIHEIWIREAGVGSKMEARQRYSPTMVETFPFPPKSDAIEEAGQEYYEFRGKLMVDREEGFTAAYNRFHNPEETADGVIEWRQLHRKLDCAVASAYGWHDLAADEGSAFRFDFYEMPYGTRWTIHPDVRSEIVDRLLSLNHERYAATEPSKIAKKSTVKRSRIKKKQPSESDCQQELF